MTRIPLVQNDVPFRCAACPTMVTNYYIVPMPTAQDESIVVLHKLCEQCAMRYSGGGTA